MLETHAYSAAQILQRIREEGFDGRYSIVKDYVRKVRPKRQPAFLKLAFAPGECAQIDWGSFGSVNVESSSRRLSFFIMVLCYSRMMYLEFTVSQTMEHFLACHQNAFDYFGSVPGKIMVDNLLCAAAHNENVKYRNRQFHGESVFRKSGTKARFSFLDEENTSLTTILILTVMSFSCESKLDLVSPSPYLFKGLHLIT